jgi:hypothetical protein
MFQNSIIGSVTYQMMDSNLKSPPLETQLNMQGRSMGNLAANATRPSAFFQHHHERKA